MSRRGLSLAEQETVILWDNELDTASIYTHDARMIGKLKELTKKYPAQFQLERRGPGRAVTYQIPKKCVSIRPPYSEERRKQQIQDAALNGSPFEQEVHDED
ncbi:MAG: immunoglobulin [Clostridiales bacterium]|nr:immunoglobulin [Clostridiales bacterium]